VPFSAVEEQLLAAAGRRATKWSDSKKAKGSGVTNRSSSAAERQKGTLRIHLNSDIFLTVNN
jgi:hypothetical protein